MNSRLHDSSVALLDALDKSEIALVKRAIFRKPCGLITFPEHIEREEKLQPVIEDMASKLNITREDLPDRWEQLVRLIVDGDCSPLFGGIPKLLNFPIDRKPSFTSRELCEVVIIKVGRAEDRKTYKIHKKFAIDCSQIFKTAFTGHFIEAETQSIDLDDMEPEVFDIFVQWLYTSEIYKQANKLPRGDLLIKLWVLGDRLMIPKLQNMALCAIEHKAMNEDQVVRTDQIHYIYENTVPGSQLRRLIIDQCTNLQHESFSPSRPVEDYPKEMLIDLITALLRRRGGEPRSIIDLSRFFVDDGTKLRPHGHVSEWTGLTTNPLSAFIQ